MLLEGGNRSARGTRNQHGAMSRLSLKCASRTKSIGPSEFAASPPSLFERAQFVGWVERLVRRSSTSEGGSDVNQFRPGCRRHTAPKHCNQHCCSVKTVLAIPPRSRSSTLCESSTPAPILTAVCISLALLVSVPRKKHGYGRVAYLLVNSRRERPKKRRAPMLA